MAEPVIVDRTATRNTDTQASECSTVVDRRKLCGCVLEQVSTKRLAWLKTIVLATFRSHHPFVWIFRFRVYATPISRQPDEMDACV
jgi:hypothetical protein